MSALTSLLARDRVLSVSKIEEALTQQVLSGGDIETVLLELNFVPEDVLSAYRAALFGLLPATREEVMRASREALRQMPEEMARSLKVVPILFEGRSLVVAAADPLADDVVRQLRAQLGCELSVRIVTQLRLAAALAHHFGVELDPRTRRLADVLRKREPGVIPYVRPPTHGMTLSQRPLYNPFDDEPESREMQALDVLQAPQVPQVQELGAQEPAEAPLEPGQDLAPDFGMESSLEAASSLEGDDHAFDSEGRASGVIELQGHADVSDEEPTLAEALTEFSESVPEFSESALAFAEAQPDQLGSGHLEAPAFDASPLEEAGAPEGYQSATLESESLDSASLDSASIGSDPAPLDVAAGVAVVRPRALSGFQAERPLTVPPSSISPAIARAVRGPISHERAEALLGEASQRDDVLFVLLRYAQQFFDFVAIFSVTKDEARGRMAHGAGLSQELMEHLVIPINEGGFAARVVRGQRPLVGDWSATDEERAALALLGRPMGRPGLAVPITLGSRVALLVYADRHAEGLSVTDAGPVMAVVPALSDALRRLILEQKTLRGRSSVPHFSTSESSSQPPTPEGSPFPDAEAAPESMEADAVADPTALLAEPSLDEHAELLDEAPELSYQGRGESEAFGSYDGDDSDGVDGLTAVDLQAVSRLSFTERKRTVSEASFQGIRSTAISPEAREAARGRVPGVPRSAPPPPMRESMPPPTASASAAAHSVGSYSYVAPVGSVAEESIRANRAPVTVREAKAAAAAKPAVEEPALREPGPVAAAAAVSRSESAEKPARTKRLSLVTDAAVPSMIIDMGDHVNALVEALLRAGPSDPLTEIAELVRIGEAVLPVLMQHFPGPLWVDLSLPQRHKVRGRDLSAVARCLAAFGDRAAPYVASKLSTSEPDLCRQALLVAGEIVHPDLLDAVARRTFDANDGVRAVALDVLRNYTRLPQFDAVLRAICDLSARPGKDPRRQKIALEALAELRDMRTLRTLIARLGDPSEGIVKTAQKALVVLTGQDFGYAPRKWELWAEQASGGHRVEWLVDSLGHQEEAMRALASDELKQLTQQYFGYHPALPKKDRELSQRKYREWWEREGRAQFARR
ncbi:MAG: hypothetical protein QM778_10995 [Myxococcales bacterium]